MPTLDTTPIKTAFDPANMPAGLNQDQQNAYKGGADAFAPPVPKPPVTPGGTPTTPTPSTDSTGTQDTSPALSDPEDRARLEQANAEYQNQATNVQSTIMNIQNGSVPLSAGEQAQVASLQQQFGALVQQQQLQNTAASGLGNIRGYQTGAAEYDPTFQVKVIGSIVTAGATKIADLQTKEAGAVAALTQSFKDNKINAVKDAWNVYQTASKARQDALQKTIDDTTAAIKAQADAADKQRSYELDVAKFNQTQDQDAFKNAFDVEQEKFAESNKTAQLALDTKQAAESKRHNVAMEGIDAYKAGMGAGGGQGVGLSKSAQFGSNGALDPASQKAVLDEIAQKYGPMTAVAIKGLADYSINPADWKPGATKGMTRDQAITLAKMYDPTFNDAMYPVRAQYMKNIASSQTGTVGSAVNAANKSVNHLSAFINTMGTIPNTPSSFINAIDNATFGNINPAVRQAKSAASVEGLGVAEELAKFFKGSGTVDVASIEAWKSQLSTNASPADVKGLAQGAITLLTGQLETLAEQYKATMGKAAETDFLGQSARSNLSNLKNQGYQVDIPGILYTDKNAYLKSDPAAAQNMQGAIKALTNAGLPLTPENILQAAQSL